MTELVADAAAKWWRFRQEPDFVAREIVGPLGIADLVAVQFDQGALKDRRSAGIRPMDDFLALRITASCRRRSFSVAELADLLGISRSGIRRAARIGWEAGALLEDGDGVRRYRTHPAWKPVGRRMVAAELKRSDWRRAIHQAWAYQAWANATWLVLGQRPPRDAPAELAKAGIGLAYLGEDEALNVVVRPPRARRLSGVVSVWTAEQALLHALASGEDPGAIPKRGPARQVAHLALPGH
ncbi:MAG TPA: hypothetical protein VJL81_09730 [Solirubrobacterales bacterium]|nr:hypothetical protein [Solirubrobacterales bacterium]